MHHHDQCSSVHAQAGHVGKAQPVHMQLKQEAIMLSGASLVAGSKENAWNGHFTRNQELRFPAQ